MAEQIETPDPDAFRLLVISESSVRTIPLAGSRWTVGRTTECDISLRDATVSRRQLVLERFGNEFRFSVLSSTNPVLLNGRSARQGVLPINGTLTVGLTRLTLDRRTTLARVVSDPQHTVVLSREILDEEEQTAPRDVSELHPQDVVCLLESLQWPLTDLGSLEDVAEPVLDLCLNITGRRRGVLGTFLPERGFRCLSSLDRVDPARELRIPEHLLQEARAARQPFTVTAHAKGEEVERLIVPIGGAGAGVILLDEPRRGAPSGQELLRLARTLADFTWNRISQIQELLRLRSELSSARFVGTSAHNAVLASRRLQNIRRRLRESSHLTMPVALVGEEGTEKRGLARLLHSTGPNASGPFLPLYCGVVPPHRIEEELFGGTRSGGALNKAQGGTLYVDRPELLADHLQERLAAAIRDPNLTAEGQSSAVQVRVVAGLLTPDDGDDAPQQSLVPALEEVLGTLRFEVPPLRDEPEDVQSLAEVFLAEMGPGPDGTPRAMSERAKRLLGAYSWPGNIRELRVVLEAAAAKAGDKPITPRHLPDEIQRPTKGGLSGLPRLAEVEKRTIRQVLARALGNRTKAAKTLGIASSTLYEKIKKYDL